MNNKITIELTAEEAKLLKEILKDYTTQVENPVNEETADNIAYKIHEQEDHHNA